MNERHLSAECPTICVQIVPAAMVAVLVFIYLILFCWESEVMQLQASKIFTEIRSFRSNLKCIHLLKCFWLCLWLWALYGYVIYAWRVYNGGGKYWFKEDEKINDFEKLYLHTRMHQHFVKKVAHLSKSLLAAVDSPSYGE